MACAGIIATGNAPNVWIAVAAFGLLFGKNFTAKIQADFLLASEAG